MTDVSHQAGCQLSVYIGEAVKQQLVWKRWKEMEGSRLYINDNWIHNRIGVLRRDPPEFKQGKECFSAWKLELSRDVIRMLLS